MLKSPLWQCVPYSAHGDVFNTAFVVVAAAACTVYLLQLLSALLDSITGVAVFAGPSSPTTLSICAALALLTPLVNPGSLYCGGKGT